VTGLSVGGTSAAFENEVVEIDYPIADVLPDFDIGRDPNPDEDASCGRLNMGRSVGRS